MLKSFKQLMEANKEFGKYIFGGFRDLEDDTTREEELFKIIRAHISGSYMNMTSTPSEVATGLEDLMKAKKDYKELQPPNEPLFRATQWYEKSDKKRFEFWKLFEGATEKRYWSPTRYLKSTKKMNIKLMSELSSWSTQFNTVAHFGGEGRFVNNKFPIIFTLDKPDKDFIFTDTLMNLIQDTVALDDVNRAENEVIRFSKNKSMSVYIYMQIPHIVYSYLFYEIESKLKKYKMVYDFRKLQPTIIKDDKEIEVLCGNMRISLRDKKTKDIINKFAFEPINNWKSIKEMADNIIQDIINA